MALGGLISVPGNTQNSVSGFPADLTKKRLLGDKILTEVKLYVQGKEITDSPEKREIERDLCVGHTRFSFYDDNRFAAETDKNCKVDASRGGSFEISEEGILSLYFDAGECKGCGNRMQFRFEDGHTDLRLTILGGDQTQTITITLK